MSSLQKLLLHPYHRTRLCIGICLFAVSVKSDQIVLKNGQSAATEIVDTTGCAVKMIRNNSKVTINKQNIQCIVWNGDTISYADFSCNESSPAATKFSETPEYKIMVLIDRAPEITQVFREHSKIAFLEAPLAGNCNAEEFIGVQRSLLDLVSTRAAVTALCPDSMLTEITASPVHVDYAFLPRKYDVAIFNDNRTVWHDGSPGFPSTSGKQDIKKLITSAEFVLFDLHRKEIVFRQTAHKKRTLTLDAEYFWTELLPLDEWRQRWNKTRVDRKLDQNAQQLIKQLTSELSSYLKNDH